MELSLFIGGEMLPISKDEVQRWRVEIDNAEDFRKNNFGLNDGINRIGAGENIEYFERGVPFGGGRGIKNFNASQSISMNEEERFHATLNMICTMVIFWILSVNPPARVNAGMGSVNVERTRIHAQKIANPVFLLVQKKNAAMMAAEKVVEHAK